VKLISFLKSKQQPSATPFLCKSRSLPFKPNMKSSTLIFATTIATIIFAQKVPRERSSRPSFITSNERVNGFAGSAKAPKRQEAVPSGVPANTTNGTLSLEPEDTEEVQEQEEEEEEEESESESESESGSESESDSESESENESEWEEEEEITGEESQTAQPEAVAEGGREEEKGGESEETRPVSSEGDASGLQGGEEIQPPMGSGLPPFTPIIDGPAGQIAMGMGVTNVDGSCICSAACPAGSMPT
jgi:hypothetical protein